MKSHILLGRFKMEEQEIKDITIIGSGPVGMFAAFYAGMRQASTRMIDSLPELGGQLQMLYPEKYIYDIPGFSKIKAQELITNLEEQIKPFHHDIHLNEEVTALERINDQYYRIGTTKGEYYSRTIIISAGNGAFKPRELSVEGMEKLRDQNIHYHISDLNRFKGKKVLVAGGGDSALDWSLMLEKIADEVHIVHRRDAFRAHEHTVKRVKESSIQLHTPFQIKKIMETEGKFEGVLLDHLKEEETKALLCDEIVVNYGYSSNLGEIKHWGLETERNTIKVASDMSTNLAGIYAIGDICSYPGKIKLIATGFGEAPTAVNNALHYAYPKERVQPAHSSSMNFG